MTVARSVIERLLDRVEISETGCWLWTGARTVDGYGQLRAGGRVARTHRIAWEHYQGPIPAGLQIDHRCRVRSCCNPDHLDVVTSGENTRRGIHGTRPLVCKRGHWLLGENVSFRQRPGGAVRRWCRACRREDRAAMSADERAADLAYGRLYQARRRAAAKQGEAA